MSKPSLPGLGASGGNAIGVSITPRRTPQEFQALHQSVYLAIPQSGNCLIPQQEPRHSRCVSMLVMSVSTRLCGRSGPCSKTKACNTRRRITGLCLRGKRDLLHFQWSRLPANNAREPRGLPCGLRLLSSGSVPRVIRLQNSLSVLRRRQIYECYHGQHLVRGSATSSGLHIAMCGSVSRIRSGAANSSSLTRGTCLL